MQALKKLHDATLVQIVVDWEKAELQMVLTPSQIYTKHTRVTLIASGSKNLSCPRQNAWGESVSINHVNANAKNGQVLLQIEMQSGDMIEVSCNSFLLEPLLEEIEQ
jgi:hypothetical protein